MDSSTESIVKELKNIQRTLNGGTSPYAQVSISSSSVAVSGSVTAGALAVTFITSDDFSGTINGITRSLSTAYVFNPTNGRTLPAVAYTIVTGSIVIDKITSV